MLFWILFVIFILSVIFFFATMFLETDEVGSMFILMVVCGFVFSIPWISHANNLAKISHQQNIIDVHKEKVESLEKRLSEFDFPEKSVVSMDNDSPWASIINSLTEAENKLAEAKQERAEAIRSVEATRHGPFNGVVTFVGDYKEE